MGWTDLTEVWLILAGLVCLSSRARLLAVPGKGQGIGVVRSLAIAAIAWLWLVISYLFLAWIGLIEWLDFPLRASGYLAGLELLGHLVGSLVLLMPLVLLMHSAHRLFVRVGGLSLKRARRASTRLLVLSISAFVVSLLVSLGLELIALIGT